MQITGVILSETKIPKNFMFQKQGSEFLERIFSQLNERIDCRENTMFEMYDIALLETMVYHLIL